MLSFKRAKCCVKTSCESYLVSTPIVCPSPPWEGWGVSHLKRSRVLVGKFEFNTLRWSIRACLELYLTQDTTWNGNDSVLLFVQRGNEQSQPLHMGFPFFWVLSFLLLLGIFIYILRSCLCILKYSKICFTLNCKPIISSASWKISRLIYKKFFLFFFSGPVQKRALGFKFRRGVSVVPATRWFSNVRKLHGACSQSFRRK